MIGVFDSGMGGIHTAQYIHDTLPAYDILVLADQQYVPYGNKDAKRIRARTFVCLQWMFDQWCKLVILACNTASTYAIRERQSTYPDKKVLSVTLPGIEAIIHGCYTHIGVLATKATIESNLYPMMLERHYPERKVHVTWCIGYTLVSLIEQQVSEDQILLQCKKVCAWFPDDIQALVLWCTHYPLIQDIILQVVWYDVVLIDPGKASAFALVHYLQKHTELAQSCTRCTWWWTMRIVSTKDQDIF